MKGKTQLRNADIAHLIPATPGWRIAVCEHGDGRQLDVWHIVGWAVINGGMPRIQPVFNRFGGAIPVGDLDARDAYEILAPGQKATAEVKARLREEADD